MKISTADLKEAFRIVDYVPVNPVLESSQFVRIRLVADKLSLAMTGSLWAEAHVTAQVNGGGKWTAYTDRRLFRTFLGTARDETEILVKEGKLLIKSGQRLETPLHAPIAGYESWTPKGSMDLEPEQAAMLKTAIKFLPSIAGTEKMEAIFFGTDEIIVTDSLLMMAMTGSMCKRTFYMPPGIARFLAGSTHKVAVDTDGVGVALPNGFVFQTRSSHLDNYPLDLCKQWVREGLSTPVLAQVKAEAFLEGLSVASQFVMDKSEAVTMGSNHEKFLGLSVATSTGKFQRSVAVTSKCAVTQPVKLPARKMIPWLEYAKAAVKDCTLSYGKLAKASVFRFTDKTRKHILLVADL